MTITYNLDESGQKLLISQVRLEIGDTVEGQGVRSDGSNFLDAEILHFLGRANDNYLLASAYACEALSREWARVANITVGPRSESLAAVSQLFASRASELKESVGFGFGGFSVTPDRADGFSDAADKSGSGL